MITWLKWRIAGDELAELHRWRVHHDMYRRWLAEFGDIAMVLDNLQAVAMGEQLDMSDAPSTSGPWTIEALREVLRRHAGRDKASLPRHIRQPMRKGASPPT